MLRYLLIALGGALGATARYQVGLYIQSRLSPTFPWGTLVVNISGCILMGAAMTMLTERVVGDSHWRFLVPIGFIGAYTTFSAFEWEVFQTTSAGAFATGAIYVVASVLAGYLALWSGVMLARFL